MEIHKLFENLTGEKNQVHCNCDLEDLLKKQFKKGGLDFCHFNEILLMLGYDKVNKEFFQFLADPNEPSTDIFEKDLLQIRSYEHLEGAIKKFQKFALLFFGNTKFAFKNLSSNVEDLLNYVSASEKIDITQYISRNDPMMEIDRISPEDTYYLGYIIQNEVQERLEKNPKDKEALEQKDKIEKLVEIGKRNNKAYLFADNIDVYVATSMRMKHEYSSISKFTTKLFNIPKLKKLNLRWFDPTQAYCSNRIDKGLAEALMLKRAECTLYLAQENDTLGKDSELASTLAQGKPVIAYIPQVDEEYFSDLVKTIESNNPEKTKKEILLQQLQVFKPSLAWNDEQIIEWLFNKKDIDENKLEKMLKDIMKEHYNKRAKTLRETHPLGIQVNLATGVANGVLVVRNIEDCASLIKKIVTQTMEFDIQKKEVDNQEYIFLKEKITDCVFRVMTGDRVLTNSFWNFYLE